MFMASVAFNCALLSVVVCSSLCTAIIESEGLIHNELGSNRQVLNDTQHAVFNKTSHFEWCEVATAPINYLGQ